MTNLSQNSRNTTKSPSWANRSYCSASMYKEIERTERSRCRKVNTSEKCLRRREWVVASQYRLQWTRTLRCARGKDQTKMTVKDTPITNMPHASVNSYTQHMQRGPISCLRSSISPNPLRNQAPSTGQP